MTEQQQAVRRNGKSCNWINDFFSKVKFVPEHMQYYFKAKCTQKIEAGVGEKLEASSLQSPSIWPRSKTTENLTSLCDILHYLIVSYTDTFSHDVYLSCIVNISYRLSALDLISTTIYRL